MKRKKILPETKKRGLSMLPSGWFLAIDQAEIAALQQKCLERL